MSAEILRRREVAVGIIFGATILLFIAWLWWEGMEPMDRVAVVSRIIGTWVCCLSPVVTFSLGWMLRARRDTLKRDL